MLNRDFSYCLACEGFICEFRVLVMDVIVANRKMYAFSVFCSSYSQFSLSMHSLLVRMDNYSSDQEVVLWF